MKENSFETNQASPFNVEQLPLENLKNTSASIDKEKLIINGHTVDMYARAAFKDPTPEFQKNNSNLLKFDACDTTEGSWAHRVVDVTNPEKELLKINQDQNKNILVNGNKWSALEGKDVYFGGYRAEVDPEGKKIIFSTVKNENNSVIVNNQEWATRFNKHISLATSRNGTAYAMTQNQLVIEDKEWLWNKTQKEGYTNSPDSLENAVVGKTGTVAAVVNSPRGSDWRRYIHVGDKQGETHQWKNSLYKINDMQIDDSTGNVAVFGSSQEKGGSQQLIINDIPYDIPGNPEKLEHFAFENGAVVIQYVDAMGEMHGEKIVLQENARDVQEQLEREKEVEDSMYALRKMIMEEGLSPSEALLQLKKIPELEKKNEKLAEAEERNLSLVNQARKDAENIESLQAQLKAQEEQLKEVDLKRVQAEMALKKVQNVLGGLKTGMMSSDFKLPSSDMNMLKAALGEALGSK